MTPYNLAHAVQGRAAPPRALLRRHAEEVLTSAWRGGDKWVVDSDGAAIKSLVV